MRRSVILRSVFSWTCRIVNLTDVLSRKRANSRVWDEKRCIILLPRRRRSLIGPCATLGCSSQELLEEMGSDVIL
jgi:hypothetical protein